MKNIWEHLTSYLISQKHYDILWLLTHLWLCSDSFMGEKRVAFRQGNYFRVAVTGSMYECYHGRVICLNCIQYFADVLGCVSSPAFYGLSHIYHIILCITTNFLIYYFCFRFELKVMAPGLEVTPWRTNVIWQNKKFEPIFVHYVHFCHKSDFKIWL